MVIITVIIGIIKSLDSCILVLNDCLVRIFSPSALGRTVVRCLSGSNPFSFSNDFDIDNRVLYLSYRSSK